MPVPLELRAQIARIEGRVYDARFRCRLGIRPREEDIAHFALSVAGQFVVVLWSARVIDFHTARLGRVHFYGDGAGP